MIRRALVALCALLLVVSTAGLAYAAGLSMSAPARPSLAVATKCDPQAAVTITGTTWRSPLTVSGLTPACGGLTLKVWLYDPGTGEGPTTDMIEAQVPHSGGDVTVPVTGMSVGPYTAGLVTVDTWPMRTTMDIYTPFASCRTPGNLSVGCTAEVVNAHSWDGFWQKTVKISNPSASPITWELMLNTSDSSVRVQPTRYLQHFGGLSLKSFAGCGAQPRTVIVGGGGGWHNETLPPGGSTTVQFQGQDPLGDAGPNMLFTCP